MTDVAVAPSLVWWKRCGAALGFHVPMLAFALRTALAAFVALAAAQALGLEHPHWAAMSVWAASQPMREHLLSRSAYRFGGSVVGVAYAVMLVLAAQGNLWVLAIGLAAWGAVCAYGGNLQRGYMVYGWMLAGYSAAMVVLLHRGPPDAIVPFAWDRMLTVVTGVAAALAISWFFAPRRQAKVLIGYSRAALADVLLAVAAQLRGQSLPQPLRQQALLSRLAQVEELLELYPEGSRTARRTAQAMHWQQHRALEVIYGLDAAAASTGPEAPLVPLHPNACALAEQLQALALALQAEPLASQDVQLHAHLVACERALAQIPHAQRQQLPASVQPLEALLQECHHTLKAEAQELTPRTARARAAALAQPARAYRLPLHQDKYSARHAAVRAGGTLLVVGILWAWTQSSVVGFAMLGLATMLLVFSGFESPSRTMAFVLRGQLIGAGLALVCQAWVWPWAQSSWQMVWMLLPFAIAAGLVFAHKRTAAGAMDTNMAMFILLAPVFPDPASMAQHASYALAVVSGPALAWVMYRWIYPTNAQRRLNHVARSMLQEVPLLAQRLLASTSVARGRADLVTPDADTAWVAQLHHRLLRLVRSADKLKWPARNGVPQMALSLRAVQMTMLQLQQWCVEHPAATPVLRRTHRQWRAVLRRTQLWGMHAPDAQRCAKAQAAWQALAQQSSLPPALRAQVQAVAAHELLQLEHAWRTCALP